MESMQASLEGEQKAKAEALRIKKKLEGDINEFEIALDHANKANNEALKRGAKIAHLLKFITPGLLYSIRAFVFSLMMTLAHLVLKRQISSILLC